MQIDMKYIPQLRAKGRPVRYPYIFGIGFRNTLAFVHSVISAKLDCFNSILIDIPKYLIAKLQYDQYLAAKDYY